MILLHVHPQVEVEVSHRLQGNQLGGQLQHPAVGGPDLSSVENQQILFQNSLPLSLMTPQCRQLRGRRRGRQRAGLARMFASKNSLRRADHLALVV